MCYGVYQNPGSLGIEFESSYTLTKHRIPKKEDCPMPKPNAGIWCRHGRIILTDWRPGPLCYRLNWRKG